MLYALLPGIGPQEMIVIGILGVLLFGKRLPEVGKSLGKGIAEFRRGFSGVESELRSIGRQATSTSPMPSRSSYQSVPSPPRRDERPGARPRRAQVRAADRGPLPFPEGPDGLGLRPAAVPRLTPGGAVP